LAELSQQAVLDIIDALITDGRLVTTGGNRPKVVLVGPVKEENEEARKREAGNEAKTSTAKEVIMPAVSSAEPDAALLETLRTWRTQQAKSQGMPPYIIFSNKVLEAIAAQRPVTLVELGDISGVGPAKLEQYGPAVIGLINQAPGGGEIQAAVREQPEIIEFDAPISISEKIYSEDFVSEQLTNPIENRKSKIQNPLEAILPRRPVVSRRTGRTPGGRPRRSGFIQRPRPLRYFPREHLS
jgi:hypothetical protein